MASSGTSSIVKESMTSQSVMQTDVPLQDKNSNIGSVSAVNNNKDLHILHRSAQNWSSDFSEEEEDPTVHKSKMDLDDQEVNGTPEDDLAAQISQMTLTEISSNSVLSDPSRAEIHPPAEPLSTICNSACSQDKASSVGVSQLSTAKSSVEELTLPGKSPETGDFQGSVSSSNGIINSPKFGKHINAETQTSDLSNFSLKTVNTSTQTSKSSKETVSAATQTSDLTEISLVTVNLATQTYKVSSETGAIPKVPKDAASRVKVPTPVKKSATKTTAQTAPKPAQPQRPRPVQPQSPRQVKPKDQRPLLPQGLRPAQLQSPIQAQHNSPRPGKPQVQTPAPRQGPGPAQTQASSLAQPQATLPTPPVTPVFEKLPDAAYTFIIFDQETTGFGPADIVQLAAKCGDRTFNQYVLPDKNISPDASEITGITKNNSKLYKDGKELPSVSIQVCLQKFEAWLQEYPSPVLVAHNCFNFDSYILTRKILKLQSSLRNKIVGFVDTLPLFKHHLQGRRSYGQEALLKDEGIEYGAHCALEDVTALDVLIKRKNIDKAMMLEYSRAMEGVIQNTIKREAKVEVKRTLYPLLNAQVVTDYIVSKMAEWGLTMGHLQAAFDGDGENGIRQLLADRADGSPRVTNRDKIIRDLNQYFASKHS